jgi:dTDP-4-amino-4,6-dideoxygalactose transaminase
MSDRCAIEGGKPIRRKLLPFFKPILGRAEELAVVRVLRSGWITTGPVAASFEQALSRRVNGQPVAAVSSATAGLFLSLQALGVKAGDEVITTPLTFVATANVIAHLGARPRFVDVQEDSMTLAPDAVRAAINRKTAAILPVHLAGQPADMRALTAIARRSHLALIEDAAHAFGASYRGKPVGVFADATVFSFHAVKNLTTAEGGAVTSTNHAVVERIRMLANHGLDADAWRRLRGRRWRYVMTEAGYKANLTDVQAAIGLSQLRRFSGFQSRRRQIAGAYTRAFARLPQVIAPVPLPHTRHAWHVYLLRLRLDRLRIGRDRFLQALAAEGIMGNVHYVPVHLQPYYRRALGYRPGSLPAAEAASRSVVTLPLYPAMTDRDVRDVIDAVEKLLRCYTR